jgi:hypothetical protein
MLYWNASNPLLLGAGQGAEPNRLLVNMNMEDQQYDQVKLSVFEQNETAYIFYRFFQSTATKRSLWINSAVLVLLTFTDHRTSFSKEAKKKKS